MAKAIFKITETFYTEAMARQFRILLAIEMKDLEANKLSTRKKSDDGPQWNVLGFRLTPREASKIESLAEGFRTGYCFATIGDLYRPEDL